MTKSIILPKDFPERLELTEDQEACVEVLKDCLQEAERGEVYAVGIVVCMKEGFATATGGRDAGTLYIGCDALKERILHGVKDNGKP